jgi:Protein of unknown function (DUF1345)
VSGEGQDRQNSEARKVEDEITEVVVPAWRRLTDGESRFGASVAIVVMIALQLRLPDDLTPSGRYLLPALELVLLVVIVAVNPRRINRRQPTIRFLSLTLIAVASVVNAWSVYRLVRGILDATFAQNDPHQATQLFIVGANIWVTNIIIFALWYWELDRGGPGSRAIGDDPDPDLLFPQMAESAIDFHHWEPEFVDYFYVSFTNAAAFSPTDTMPLSRWAKMLMTLQSAVSLATAVLVIARAINIL